MTLLRLTTVSADSDALNNGNWHIIRDVRLRRHVYARMAADAVRKLCNKVEPSEMRDVTVEMMYGGKDSVYVQARTTYYEKDEGQQP